MKRMTVRFAVPALSMMLVSATVKAQDKALPTSNPAPALKDSVKDGNSEISRLVEALMLSGKDGEYPNGLAQAVGLDRPLPAKAAFALVGREARRCQVIFERDETAGNRPLLIHLVRTKKTEHDLEERLFRVSLDGTLERVITFRNKLDENGKPTRESRSKTDEDIDSPKVRKIFKVEMAFWLKDWLKKQKKLDAKKATASATHIPAAAQAVQ